MRRRWRRRSSAPLAPARPAADCARSDLSPSAPCILPRMPQKRSHHFAQGSIEQVDVFLPDPRHAAAWPLRGQALDTSERYAVDRYSWGPLNKEELFGETLALFSSRVVT